VPARVELELELDGTRLWVRGAGSLGVRELTPDDELPDDVSEPPEPPEPPEELPPDDPEDEPDDPEEVVLPRGTAWAPAVTGAASAIATSKDSVRRVDLAMVVLLRPQRGAPRATATALMLQLYCHLEGVRNCLSSRPNRGMTREVSSGLALPGGRNYDPRLRPFCETPS